MLRLVQISCRASTSPFWSLAQSIRWVRGQSGPRVRSSQTERDDFEGVHESEASVDRQKVWSDFVQKPSELERKSLERQNFTSFGSIRFDHENLPEVHGQQDLVQDEAEFSLESKEKSSSGLIGDHGMKRVKVKDAGETHERNFFFENDEDFFQKPQMFFETKSGENLQTNDSSAGKRVTCHFGTLSKPPETFTTFVPPLTGESTGQALPDEETMNFIDKQFFDGLKNLKIGEKIMNEPLKDQMSENPLSEIDRQYFESARYVNEKVEVDQKDWQRVRELMKQATEDLHYIDQQIFSKNESQSFEKLDNLSGMDNGTHKHPRQENSKGLHKRKANKESLEQYGNTIAGSALDYVQKHLRNVSSHSGAIISSNAPKSKEELVDEIDYSLQKRIALASKAHISIENLKINVENSDSEQDLTQVQSKKTVFSTVSDKFKPLNLFDLASYEVIKLLQENIIYNDNEILAINKPFGLPMFGDNEPHTVEKYLPHLADHVNVPNLFEVHRLDKSTSGILLLAKSSAMHDHLRHLFKRRMIDKRYWTVVRGIPEPAEGIINIPIGISKVVDRYRMSVQPNYSNSKIITNKKSSYRGKELFPAVTEYRILKSKEEMSLLEVKPITGYRNQIRVQLGFGISCPVIADHKFTYISDIGKPQKLPGNALRRLQIRQSKVRDLPILLHCKYVQIPEIVEGKQIWIDAKLPKYFNKIMRKLKLNPDDTIYK